MGKTLNRDERKNSKYLRRDDERKRKERQYSTPSAPKRPAPRPKRKPHSEIDAD